MLSDFYKIEDHAKSLPRNGTHQTHVAWNYQEGKNQMGSFGYEPRFLIKWIEARGYKMPSWFKPIESIYQHQREIKSSKFDDSQLLVDGWVNVRKIESTKLVLAIESYIVNMADKAAIPHLGKHFP